MSRPPDSVLRLSDTLTLSRFDSGGNAGFWLYDETRGMNLSMRAKSETAAFVESLRYYQRRLKDVESEYASLYQKVDAFVDQFTEDECGD